MIKDMYMYIHVGLHVGEQVERVWYELMFFIFGLIPAEKHS